MDGDTLSGIIWPEPRFTENCNQTITDNLTGLIWAKDAGVPKVGSSSYRKMYWTKALDYVDCLNTVGYLGHKDWRLPNINELHSLIHLGQKTPGQWLGTMGYINIQYDWYWSSTTQASSTDRAWVVNMCNGMDNYFGKTYKIEDFRDAYVLPVRGGLLGTQAPAAVWKTGQTQTYYPGDDGTHQAGVAWPNPRFSDHGDGTVTDNLTALMWTKDANLGQFNSRFSSALYYIARMNTKYSTFGYSDWRLPNRNEIRSLVDYSNSSSALPPLHPFMNVRSNYEVEGTLYWSSTYCNSIGDVWQLIMFNGSIDNNDPNYGNGYLWPVRGGHVEF
ncbi:MAG: DUF1566 domain-containing protein [Nitrospirae bacterium]|nr:DUF1566 domain-containing protein [Nitrospirota bacterium]